MIVPVPTPEKDDEQDPHGVYWRECWCRPDSQSPTIEQCELHRSLDLLDRSVHWPDRERKGDR